MTDFPIVIPYASGGRLGAAYADALDAAGDGWVCILDHDVLMLHPNWVEVCRRVIAEADPRAGLLTCWTNRIMCPTQRLGDAPAHDDIAEHRARAREVWDRWQYGTTDITDQTRIGGFFMLVNGVAWRDGGALDPEAFLGVDNALHQCLAAAGWRVLRMDGLYAYHMRQREDRVWIPGLEDPMKRTKNPPAKAAPQNNRVIYTVLIGDYDAVPASPTFSTWDCVLFTDQDIHPAGWRVCRITPADGLSPAMASRRPKLLPHEYLREYDYSVYVDANLELRADPADLCERCKWPDFAAALHPASADLYAEVARCILKGKASPGDIIRQAARYVEDGYPGGAPITENGVLLRRHNAEPVRRLDEAWWTETLRATHRDQLSLPYVRWLLDQRITTFRPALRDRILRRHEHREPPK